MVGSPVAWAVVMGVAATVERGVMRVGKAGEAETVDLGAVEAQPEGATVEVAWAGQGPAGNLVVMAVRVGVRVVGEMEEEAMAEAVTATGAPWVGEAMEVAGKELHPAGLVVGKAAVVTVAVKEEGVMVAATVEEAWA